MSFKKFDWYSWGVALLLSFCLFFLLGIVGCVSSWILSVVEGQWGVFVFDVTSFYLCVLSIFLAFTLVFILYDLSLVGKIMLSLSVLSSVLCYCSVNGLWFWIFYEMSILPLLLLLILESPYSERFVASWYLLGYVVFTSLPMLLCILYISGLLGSYNLQVWGAWLSEGPGFMIYILLAVMFITKIPLPPFHVWLPIVHAEASSPVSICLSGYIMKLGLLGVFRFGSHLLPDYIFGSGYMIICLWFAVMFFFSASRELDGKRWLAFLSLAHIAIASICFCVCGYDNASLSYLYCLGHGLSAGVTFLLLWLVYNVSGSRNWSVLKCVFSSGLLFRCLAVSCICTTASIPPTVQFFSEVAVVTDSGFMKLGLVGMLFFYLFLSGLVPLFLAGSVLTRHYTISFGGGYVSSFLYGTFFLVVWSFILFLVF